MALLVTIGFTTLCWVITTYVGPETDRKVLIEFYKKVHPFGPGWKRIRLESGVSEAEARATHENIPMALLGWVTGCTVIWSALFALGNYLYGRLNYAFMLTGIFIVSGSVLVYVVNRLWNKSPQEPQAAS
jgi:hypothetical protein